MTPGVGDYLHSLRLRAVGVDGRHLGGAERLVPTPSVPGALAELETRARRHGPRLRAWTVRLDRRPAAEVGRATLLPLSLPPASGPAATRRLAEELLARAGVSPAAREAAFAGLTAGFAPGGGALAGAVLLHADTGERLRAGDPRGVRVRHFDYDRDGAAAVDAALAAAGLTHFRTREALALASRVAWAGVQAEVCWSDDPDYPTGYVAAACLGYVRLPDFRPAGAAGGRVFFVPPDADVDALLRRLREAWTLIAATNAAAEEGSPGPPAK
jgi:6-carboxyhexanoate--CoA ligase